MRLKDFLSKYIKWLFLTVGTILLGYALWNSSQILTTDEKVLGTITPAVQEKDLTQTAYLNSALASKLFEPTATPYKIIPVKIVIEKIELEAPIIPVDQISVKIAEQNYAQFLVPEEFAVGWHAGSASIGEIGNTVLSGHHNAYGKVFENLIDLEIGDVIKLISEKGDEYEYVVSNKMIFPEKDEPLDVRLENGRWILPTDDERLTLVTCWPEDSNTHRLIIVAVPMPDYSQFDEPLKVPEYFKNIDLKTPVALHLIQQTVTPRPRDVCSVRSLSPFDINIRRSPTLNSEVIGLLFADSEAKCVGKTANNKWIKVYFEDVEGWVAADVVEIHPDIDLLPLLLPP
ncbi:MAG: sortase [Anaerolineaceae bacterium]|nr:sortase [Anaerolineaceae bacterium]